MSKTSIFVTNFPPSISKEDLRKRCESWGKVVEVFIPNKLSRSGLRFAFVRYVDVSDVNFLISKLRSVWIGKYRLVADAARESRSSVKNADGSGLPNIGVKTFPTSVQVRSKGLSFADVVSGRDHTSNNISRNSASGNCSVTKKLVTLSQDDLCFASNSSSSVLVELLDIRLMEQLIVLFHKERFLDVKIIYVGGKWARVEFPSDQSCELFKNCKALREVFLSIKPVSNFFRSAERMVWIEVDGLPFCAWSVKAFKKLSECWGSCIFVDDKLQSCQSIGRICILTNVHLLINETVVVSVEGKSFNVHVRECESWAPKFLSPLVMHRESNFDVSRDGSQFVGSDNLNNEIESETLKESKVDNSNIVKVVDSVVEDYNNVKGNDHDSLTDTNMKEKSENLSDKIFSRVDHVVTQGKKPYDNGSDLDSDASCNATKARNAPMYDQGVINDSTLEDKSGSCVEPPKSPSTTEDAIKEHKVDSWDMIWYYRDPTRKIQGPFSIIQLRNWNSCGCFPKDVKIWNTSGSEKDGVLLHLAIKLEHRTSSNGG